MFDVSSTEMHKSRRTKGESGDDLSQTLFIVRVELKKVLFKFELFIHDHRSRTDIFCFSI